MKKQHGHSQNVSTKNTDNFLEGERRKFLEAMERLDDIGLSPSAIVHTLTARGQRSGSRQFQGNRRAG